MKKILLFGIGTYKNRGVEAIVNSTINQISNDYNITIASLDNDYNKNYYKNKIKKYINHINKSARISDTYTTNYKKLKKIQEELIKEVSKNDIIISAGGDNYSYNVNDWLYVIEESAKENNKKLILWGASVLEKIDDLNLIKHMNDFDILYIRESISYNALKDYVDNDKLILAPDPAFCLKAKKVALDPWYNNKKIVGINLSPFIIKKGDENTYNSILNLINYILENTDYSISLIPHVIQKESNDMLIHKKIKKLYKNEPRIFLEKDSYNCEEIKYIISKCSLMVAARTHASIAAYSQCIPTLVLGYSVKSKGIAKDLFGSYSNYVLPYEEINQESIIDNFKWIDDNKKTIKKSLEKIMPDIIKKSSNIFNEIIEKIEQNESKTICKKSKCIGCGLCKNVCNNNAITFEKDELGFIYPKIDIKKCTKCGLCRKACPINNKIKVNNQIEKKCYACKSKDDKKRIKSSSGGIFPIISSNFIKQYNGVVYGAISDGNKIKHIRVDNEEKLSLLQGSKYAQSDMSDILSQIRNDIKKEKMILFSGTPCQVGAVKKLANNYKKIYYVSVICRGVMSEDFAKTVLKAHGYSDEYIIKYRGKEIAWDEPTISISKNEEKYVKRFNDSDIMKAYLLNANLRESCYSCKFKSNNNNADIIIGDFWGIQNYHKEIYDKNGISAIIVNTKNGERLLKKLNVFANTNFVSTKYEYLVNVNPMLEKSIDKHLDRYLIKKYCNPSQILLFINNLELKNIISLKNENIDLLNKNISNNYKIIESLKEDISSIKNSKRWKVIDKIANIITRKR